MSHAPLGTEDGLEALVSEIKDWQLTHGSTLKIVRTNEEHTVLSHPVGCTLFPTPFPKTLYEEALSLQKAYNQLYAEIAEKPDWLYQVLKDIIEVDPLANALWSIYQEVEKEGFLQNTTLGIFRSDYMIHAQNGTDKLELKQVEFNTVACAGGVHSNMISDMHRHLFRKGYQSSYAFGLDAPSLPPNSTLETIVAGLEGARYHYEIDGHDIDHGKSVSGKTCILMVVQPHNFNIADERPIEYALWDKGNPTYRVTFGSEVLSQTSLTPTGELIYAVPNSSTQKEVSVVYFRSGFEAREYDDIGQRARFQLEKSRAIKCPSLLSHLTTFKKVQQALCLRYGTSELFHQVNEDDEDRLKGTFAPQYPLDKSKLGEHGRELALNPETARNHILKPSREGGGHNYYGEDITKFLEATPKEMWHQYILMERITPPLVSNILMSPRGLYKGLVISELGVFGVCIWKTAGKLSRRSEMIENYQPCCSSKTKDASVNEMSVVKGYGCFDSPALVNTNTFLSLAKKDGLR